MSFLTAEWRKLAIANYVVPPQTLAPYLPAHTELDMWQDRCYVSLVGFMFVNVRVMGVAVPWHTRFEEVNLRFYVRHQHAGAWRRGVVFVKEIVPRHAISLVANNLYREHYQTMPMRHQWHEHSQGRNVGYQWWCNGQWHSFRVEAAPDAQEMPVGSEEEFITEHYFGYTRHTPRLTYEYEVRHPRWQVYTLRDHHIAVDFGAVYGDNFAFLNALQPASVMLAEGSAITVENKRRIA